MNADDFEWDDAQAAANYAVSYTERGERIRIISARRATKHEQDDYYQQNG